MEPGEVVDQRFQVEAEIAKGGMGKVYRALDRHTGAVVALKVAAVSYGGTAERFKREALILAEIDHPGVVDYVAHGDLADGTAYLAMEWLDGVDLADRLTGMGVDDVATAVARTRELAADNPELQLLPHVGLPLEDVITLGKRIASALAAMHERGLVHRDLKPANLFLVGGEVARAVLVDFGTAREAMPERPLTAEGVLVGTPYYMAPEQARGDVELGPAVDVWGLGCVLYQCLAGKPPFAAPHPLAALARIVVDDPTPVEFLRPDTPDDLAHLIKRTLSKEPTDRPIDGTALLDDLNLLAPIDLAKAVARASAQTQVLAPDFRPPSATHLTTGETRVCSLLFARAEADADLTVLRAYVEEHGGTFRKLAGLDGGAGSILVTVENLHAPVDQAAAAARIALALRAVHPSIRQVLATGRGRGGGQSPMGDLVDSAVSLLLTEAPGDIGIDKMTAGLVDARFEVSLDGDRGLLLSEKQAEETRTLLGKPSRWVGRRREMSSIVATFDECVEDRVARVVLVTAPAGIGKSRLRFESVRTLHKRADTLVTLHGQGDSLSAGSPFVMIAPAIRRLAGILDGEALGTRRHKLRARLAETVPPEDLDRLEWFLGELIGVPAEDDASESLRAARADKLLLGQLMEQAFVDWLDHETACRPVLLVLEDLHWGDRPSTTYVDTALRALANRPFMVLALARPEVHEAFPRLWENRELDELKLHALTPRACRELARDALGDADDEVIEEIVGKSEGNAFYLEELIRTVAEGGAGSLPESVIGMVQARLDGLPLEARRILRAASIFGEVFWDGGVRALLGDGDAFDVGEWLRELARREVVTPQPSPRLPGQSEYVFRHALVRDGAYEMLTEHDRELGHLLAGAWLVNAGERDGLALANHFDAGGDGERAIHWYLRATVQALEGNDLPAVIERAERAAAAGATGQTLGELRALEANAAYWQSDYERARDFGRDAIALAPLGSTTWFNALGSAIVSAARLGDYDSVDELFDRAMNSPRAQDASAAQLICLCRGTFQLIFAGRFHRADEVLIGIAALSSMAGEIDALTYAQVNHVQGVRAAHVGDVRTFLTHLERAVDGFERAGDTRNVCLERTTVAWCWAEIGELARAEHLCRDNLAHCQNLRAQQAMTYARVNLGYILSVRPGKLAEAREVLTQAITECQAVGNSRLEGWARAHLATVEHLAGDHAAEEEHARTASRLLSVSPGLQAWALATWSRALLANDRVDEAVEHAREAMDILSRLGGLLQGESLPPLVLARALRAAGRRAAARDAARDARQRLQRRAQRLQDPAWVEAFLALPDNAATLELHRKLSRSR